ncbi:MAG TPA: outer membrane beta-barrel protein [Roseiflexaceae bacterium]
MDQIKRLPWVILLIVLLPGLASAQRRGGRAPVPDTNMIAVGGDAGVFVPHDDTLDAAPIIEGTVDFYVTPRLSLRPGVSLTDPPLSREDSDSVRQIRIGFDVIYNWERGRWHPFAGGGLGAHFIQPKDNGHAFGDQETKAGVSVLGGVEYFLNRRVSLKGEGRFQQVNDVRGFEPTGVALTFGVKRYF